MPLLKGQGSIRRNVKALMQAPQAQTRKRAIATLAKKHNISRQDAQFRQSIAIAKSQSKK